MALSTEEREQYDRCVARLPVGWKLDYWWQNGERRWTVHGTDYMKKEFRGKSLTEVENYLTSRQSTQ